MKKTGEGVAVLKRNSPLLRKRNKTKFFTPNELPAVFRKYDCGLVDLGIDKGGEEYAAIVPLDDLFVDVTDLVKSEIHVADPRPRLGWGQESAMTARVDALLTQGHAAFMQALTLGSDPMHCLSDSATRPMRAEPMQVGSMYTHSVVRAERDLVAESSTHMAVFELKMSDPPVFSTVQARRAAAVTGPDTERFDPNLDVQAFQVNQVEPGKFRIYRVEKQSNSIKSALDVLFS